MKPGGQRIKGKVFERKIAAMIRARWPNALVRRASQAERAHNPDVFVEGGPRVLGDLWMELCDERKPRPLAKLDQAERDAIARFHAAHDPRYPRVRFPVVVWHRLRERTCQVTTRMWVLEALRDTSYRVSCSDPVVTLDLAEFIEMVRSKAQAELEVAELEVA